MVKNTARVLSGVMLMILLLTVSGCGDGERKVTEYAFKEAFITNVYQENKTVLKCSIVLEVYADMKTATLEEKDSTMRDAINKILRSKDINALSDPNVLSILSLEIAEALNNALTTDAFIGAKFSEFYTA